MMNFDKKTLAASLALIGTVGFQAQAANLNTGDVLTITTGVYQTGTTCINNVCTTSVTNVTGSWFGMDTGADGVIQQGEKTALSQGTTGIVIGATSAVGANHSGPIVAGDTSAFTAPWEFFGNTGSNYVTTAITGGTTGLDFTGWTVAWNLIPVIPMGTGAWGAGFTNSVANFVWDGIYGHAYTLNYRATVPLGDPSGFGNVKYAVRLVGVVQKAVTGAPAISSTVPDDAQAGVAGNLAKYVLTFDKAMDTTTILQGSISLNNGASVNGAPTCTSDKLTCVFPLAGVANTTTYTVTFNSGPKDLLGNNFVAASRAFTTATADNGAPSTTISPTGGNVAVASPVTLVFNEAMDPNTVASAFSLTGPGGAVATTMSTTDDITFVFTPTAELTVGATYTVALSTAAKDLANNAAPAATGTFTTAVPPQAVLVLPSSSGAGGGCAVNSGGRFDFSLILALLASFGYAAWRRKRG